MADMNLGTLVVNIEAAIGDFQRQIAEVSDNIEELSAQIQPLGQAAGVAFAAMGAGLGYLVKMSSDASRAQLNLEAAIKSTGGSIDVAKINDLAGALQQVSTFGDDTTQSAAALYTRLGLNEEQILALIPATADLAAAFGGTLPDAAMKLGRAISTGSAEMLREQGIVLDDLTNKAFVNADQNQRLSIIMEKLGSVVGGAANEMTRTAGGAFDQMTNSLGDVAEAAGGIFEPVAVSALRSVEDALASLATNLQSLSPAMRGMVQVGTGLAMALTGITAAATGLMVLLKSAAFLALKTAFAAALPFIAAATGAIVGLVAIGVTMRDLWKAMGGSFSGFFDSWVDTIEYAAGSLLGLENDGKGMFSSLAQGASDAAQSIGDYFADLGSDIVDWISDGFTSAFDDASNIASDFLAWIMASLPNSFAQAIEDIAPYLQAFGDYVMKTITDSFGSAFSWVSELVQGVVDWIAELFGTVGKAIYDAIVGAIEKVVGVVSSIFGTAFDYWKQKFESVGEDVGAAATGAVGPGMPGAVTSAQGAFGALGRKEIERLAAASAESAEGLEQLREKLLTTAQQSQVVADTEARTAEFLDRLNQVIEEGLQAADIKSFMKDLEKAGGSLSELASAATRAAQEQERLAAIEAQRTQRFRGASAAGAAEAFAPLEDAGRDFAEGASAALYNTAADLFGPDSGITGVAGDIGEAFDQLGAEIGGQLLGKLGTLGETISAGIQGFQAGGPWGAIIAVAAQLISQAPAFEQISETLNEAAGELIQSLNGVLRGFQPVAEALGSVVSVVADLLEPVLEAFGSVFYTLGVLLRALLPIFGIAQPLFEALGWIIEKLSQVIAAVSWGILWVVRGIGQVWNGIVGAVQQVFDKLREIEVFGQRPFSFMDSWSRSLERARVDTDGISQSMRDLETIIENGVMPAAEAMDDGLGDAASSVCNQASDTSMCEATAGFTDSVAEATESLLNVPQGYKVAAARFNAAIAETMGPPSAAMSPTSPASVAEAAAISAPQTTIEQVTIVSDDPEEVWEGVQEVIRFQNYRNTGSSVSPISPYAIRSVE